METNDKKRIRGYSGGWARIGRVQSAEISSRLNINRKYKAWKGRTLQTMSRDVAADKIVPRSILCVLYFEERLSIDIHSVSFSGIHVLCGRFVPLGFHVLSLFISFPTGGYEIGFLLL